MFYRANFLEIRSLLFPHSPMLCSCRFHVEPPLKKNKDYVIVLRTATRKWKMQTTDAVMATQWYEKLVQLQTEHNLQWDHLEHHGFNVDDVRATAPSQSWPALLPPVHLFG